MPKYFQDHFEYVVRREEVVNGAEVTNIIHVGDDFSIFFLFSRQLTLGLRQKGDIAFFLFVNYNAYLYTFT